MPHLKFKYQLSADMSSYQSLTTKNQYDLKCGMRQEGA